MNPAQRVAQLRREIENHNYRYHVRDEPLISDPEFDLLYRELVELEKSRPDLISIDSPTQRVGAEPQERFRKVAHRAPMLSLANAFDETELGAFYRRIAGQLEIEDIRLVTELKIDGVAVALTYEEGLLRQGATRGNGLEGEDVTTNLRTIRSLPLRLREEPLPSIAEIRGEVYFPLSGFRRVNRQREQNEMAPFANPRNAAAGALRQLDPRRHRLPAPGFLRLFRGPCGRNGFHFPGRSARTVGSVGLLRQSPPPVPRRPPVGR